MYQKYSIIVFDISQPALEKSVHENQNHLIPGEALVMYTDYGSYKKYWCKE